VAGIASALDRVCDGQICAHVSELRRICQGTFENLGNDRFHL